MKLNLHTKSRDGLYEAKSIYKDGVVTVLKNSRINNKNNPNFKPSETIKSKIEDKTLVDNNGVVLKDIEFNSLSTAATFVAGRISNGMITWKTDDGKYVRYTLKETK